MRSSGDASAGGFACVGFLSARAGERAEQLGRIAGAVPTQIVFEAPHRIATLLQALAAACPARRITLCRELTKQFETVVTLRAAKLPAWLAADANRSRGEFVLVLHALEPIAIDEAAATTERLLATLLRELPLKQAVALAAELSGAPRNALYKRALELRDSQRQ